MRRQLILLAVATLSISSAAAIQTAHAAPGGVGHLDLYTVRAPAADAAAFANGGLDVVSLKPAGATTEAQVVLSPAERHSLEARGYGVKVTRDKHGRSQAQRAAAQAASGYAVYRSWDEPGGIRDELHTVAKQNPQLVKLEVLGHTYGGRELLALKLTQGARGLPDGSRPAVLYSATQHAREWISTEVDRRLLHYFIDRWRANDKTIKHVLKSTELWFVVVANPDGYQYTFDHERLWRKNLRDNNGDGQITGVDGVDPNRNFNEHWNYDNEGSSTLTSSDTYRGPAPASEPETRAMQGLLNRIKPKLQSNFHSFGPYILFPQGWQVGTPDADNPIYTALGGTDAHPAIPGFDPGLSADELYVTNGETTDFADVHDGTISFTPELDEGCTGCGFVFPDDEALVQAEFVKTLPFDLSLATSATHVATPDSAVGATTKPFYLSQTEVDAENGALSMFDFRFDKSYGDPQEVRVLARRGQGRITLNYQINGGAVQHAVTSEWTRGHTYGVGNANYYRVMRGQVTGTSPGDSVKVWFSSSGAASDSFTYQMVSNTHRKVLILSAEDYTGASPAQGVTAPKYLSYYTKALDANGISYDVYDVDANGRTAPDPLGVLAHYDAVIWYTGDDVVTREPGWGAGTASRLAMTELLSVRDYLNEGGRVLYTGKYAGDQYSPALGNQLYDPFENQQCTDPITARCRPLGGSGDSLNDVLEYWFGVGLLNDDAGTDPETGDLHDVVGSDVPFMGTSWTFNGADSAANQDHSASFIPTSALLPADQYPQFESVAAAKYDRPGGPYDPHTGSYYMYSQIADVSYKRLTRTIDVPPGGATMSFWTSYDTEQDWDHVFVEARTAGGDDWTTLPDLNGHTSHATGQSCPAGWRTLHPQLDHYQTLNADNTCSPTGTTGSWNAATGNSAGWQQWSVDLSAFAGKTAEISIAYVSDWSTQGLGMFVDDIAVSTGEGSTSFETGPDGWTVTQPTDSAPNPNNFERLAAGSFPEAAVVRTRDTIYVGFGLEGITGSETRNAVLGNAMTYLLR